MKNVLAVLALVLSLALSWACGDVNVSPTNENTNVNNNHNSPTEPGISCMASLDVLVDDAARIGRFTDLSDPEACLSGRLDFGDGSEASSHPGSSLSHAYIVDCGESTDPVSFTATLEETGADGATSTSTEKLTFTCESTGP